MGNLTWFPLILQFSFGKNIKNAIFQMIKKLLFVVRHQKDQRKLTTNSDRFYVKYCFKTGWFWAKKHEIGAHLENFDNWLSIYRCRKLITGEGGAGGADLRFFLGESGFEKKN